MRRNYLEYIESFEDFPKPGVLFWDFTPLTLSPEAFADAIDDFADYLKDKPITKIVAIEAKGFIIGSALSLKMKLPLVLIRKPGLIPGSIYKEEFVKEYGLGEYQMKEGTLDNKDSVVIVYDILAASGALIAAKNLVEKSGSNVVGAVTVIELLYLKGREGIKDMDIYSLVKIDNKQMK